jgi:hypothetical protein
LFPHHISLNFDDSEAGSFLTIIGSQEISKVKASSGKENHDHHSFNYSLLLIFGQIGAHKYRSKRDYLEKKSLMNLTDIMAKTILSE